MYAGDMSVATASILARERRSRTQKSFKASRAFSLADVHHGPTLQVQHDRQVAVPLGRGDLVDGDLPHFTYW